MDQEINPSIIKRRRRATLAAIGAGLAVVCAAVWGVNRAVAPSAAANELNIAEVRQGSIADTISASGIVVPVHEEQVPSPIQTRIAKIHAVPPLSTRWQQDANDTDAQDAPRHATLL